LWKSKAYKNAEGRICPRIRVDYKGGNPRGMKLECMRERDMRTEKGRKRPDVGGGLRREGAKLNTKPENRRRMQDTNYNQAEAKCRPERGKEIEERVKK